MVPSPRDILKLAPTLHQKREFSGVKPAKPMRWRRLSRTRSRFNIHPPRLTNTLSVNMYVFASKMIVGLCFGLEIIGVAFTGLVGFYIVLLCLGAIPFFQRQ